MGYWEDIFIMLELISWFRFCVFILCGSPIRLSARLNLLCALVLAEAPEVCCWRVYERILVIILDDGPFASVSFRFIFGVFSNIAGLSRVEGWIFYRCFLLLRYSLICLDS